MVQLKSIHDYWENHSLDYTDFVGIVMFLLFNILSSFVNSFPSKEQAPFNFMAAVTIHSDFGAQENKICHCFHFFTFYLPWSDGTGCHCLCCYLVTQWCLTVTPWTAAGQASLSFTVFWSCSNSCPLSWWGHPTISSSVIPSIIVFLALTFKPDFSLCSFTLIRGLFSSSTLSAVEWCGWWPQPWDLMGSLVPCLSPSRLLKQQATDCMAYK